VADPIQPPLADAVAEARLHLPDAVIDIDGGLCANGSCFTYLSNPFGTRISTAIAVRTLLPLARPPRGPGSSPPM
jgi:hypothetical protein